MSDVEKGSPKVLILAETHVMVGNKRDQIKHWTSLLEIYHAAVPEKKDAEASNDQKGIDKATKLADNKTNELEELGRIFHAQHPDDERWESFHPDGEPKPDEMLDDPEDEVVDVDDMNEELEVAKQKRRVLRNPFIRTFIYIHQWS